MSSIVAPVWSGIPLVHTTSLRLGQVQIGDVRVAPGTSIVNGPTVLVPRVGRPSATKICLYSGCDPIAISDCVISIQGCSSGDTRALFELIKRNSELLVGQYGGSCAKYITMTRLQRFLGSIGIEASVRRSGANTTSAEAPLRQMYRTPKGEVERESPRSFVDG
jgi:hypothetical protein